MTDPVALKQATNANLTPCEDHSNRVRRSRDCRQLLLFPALEHLFCLPRLRLYHPSRLQTLSVIKLQPGRSLHRER
jgi:hypothetical protein